MKQNRRLYIEELPHWWEVPVYNLEAHAYVCLRCNEQHKGKEPPRICTDAPPLRPFGIGVLACTSSEFKRVCLHCKTTNPDFDLKPGEHFCSRCTAENHIGSTIEVRGNEFYWRGRLFCAWAKGQKSDMFVLAGYVHTRMSALEEEVKELRDQVDDLMNLLRATCVIPFTRE